MKKNKKDLIYDINERPPLNKWIVLAFQHVFAMFGATVLVPVLVNTAAGSEVMSIPTALICSGIGTIIYIICTLPHNHIIILISIHIKITKSKKIIIIHIHIINHII